MKEIIANQTDQIDELKEIYNLKIQSVEEISRQMKELGLSFVAQDYQIKSLLENVVTDLNALKNKL